MDIAGMLSYSTTKQVKIKDVRLGIAYLLCVGGVFLYALVYVLLNQKNYLELADTDFSLRLNLQAPTDTSLIDPTLLPYCTQNGSSTIFGRPTSPCLVQDQFDVVFPPPQGGAIFMTTRDSFTTLHLPPNCTARTSLQCTFPDITDNNTDSYFVAGLEDFTLFVDHTLIASQFDISRPYYKMHGSFMNSDGSVMYDLPPSEVENARNIFTVRDFLTAAGISNLDAEQSVTYKNNTSMRNDGVVLLVTITYSNWVQGSFALSAFNLGYYTYKYNVMHVTDTEYKTYETQYLDYPTKKIITNRHGIRLVFLAEGQLGQFSFPVLLIALVSSFGLLSASVIGLDFIATRFLRERHLYCKHKYDQVDKDCVNTTGLSDSLLATAT